MPTAGTNAQLLLTAEITAGGTAATAGLVIMGMGRTVLQKVRSSLSVKLWCSFGHFLLCKTVQSKLSKLWVFLLLKLL